MRCEQVGRPIQFGMLARLVRPKAREVTVRTVTSLPLAVTVHTVTSLALLYNSVSPSSFELSSCVSLSPCQNWPRAGAWGGARGVGLGQDKIGIGRVPGAGPGGWGRAKIKLASGGCLGRGQGVGLGQDKIGLGRVFPRQSADLAAQDTPAYSRCARSGTTGFR